MRADAIVNGDDYYQLPWNIDRKDSYVYWSVDATTVAWMIRLCCSPAVWHIGKGIRYSHEILETVETNLDATISNSSRQGILRHFHSCQPKTNIALKAFLTIFCSYSIPLDHINNAITNWEFETQLLRFQSSLCMVVLMVLKHWRLIPIPEEAMHNFLAASCTTSLRK
jgi:hypothetical protein